MTLGASIFLLAIGAILYFALEATVAGINLDVVGVILMVVGAIGLLFSLLYSGGSHRGGVVHDDHEHVV